MKMFQMEKIRMGEKEAQDYIKKGKEAEYKGPKYFFEKA